jgi:hypothetical protein
MLIDLKEFYGDSDRVKIIEKHLLSMLESMKKNNTLNSADEKEEEQDPTVYLWILYYLAQHYLFIKNYPEAFKYINEAIIHTPTVIELYIVKA